MEEEGDTTSDHTLEELAARLVWKFAKRVLRFLWNLATAIFTSIVAGLILLVGVSAVLGFGMLGLALIILLIKTAVSLVARFGLSIIVSTGVFVAVVRGAAFLARRRIPARGRWKSLRRPLKRIRAIVVRLRAFGRTAPPREQMVTVTGVILALATIFLTSYLAIWGLEPWNQLRSARLPTRVPVEQVGRRSMPQILTVADADKYSRSRSAKVAAMKRTLVQSNHGRGLLPSRCGSVLAPLPTEMQQLAELLVDLAQAPPIIKREYVLTEDELTAALSALLQSRSTSVILDCVKLHHDSIELFATTVDSQGVRQNQALGVSVTKMAGRLSILLEELSIGRGSFQLGWLGIGVTGDRNSFPIDDNGSAEIDNVLRALDSRILRININEGYMRIATWRLPSMVAARAAEAVGHVREAAEHLVEPDDCAASLGKVSSTELIYILETRDHWLYGCSEVSGRCGWLPDTAFINLQDELPL
jgi:hypothetical protein